MARPASGSSCTRAVAAVRAAAMTSPCFEPPRAAAASCARPTASCRARRPRGAAAGRARTARSRRSWTPRRRAAPGRASPPRPTVTSRHSDGQPASTDAAAQLVQLRDAEPVGVHDHHHRRLRHVDADLDHGRRDEHVEPARGVRVGEPPHGVLLLLGAPCGRAAPRSAVPPARPRPATGRGRARRTRVRRRHRSGVPRPRPTSPAARRRTSSSPIRGQTTNTRWPFSASSRTRAHARARSRGCSGAHDMRRDRKPARRQLGQDGHLDVAEHGHRDGARDGRGRHDEDVRPRPVQRLGRERRPLLDAEPVLLVDDDEPEVAEGDGVLEQGVRADDDARIARHDVEQLSAPGRRPAATR